MSKYVHYALYVFLSLSVTNCEKFGLLGQGGVPGSTVKSEIVAAATASSAISNTAVCASLGSSYASFCNSYVGLSVIMDTIIAPITAKVSDSKHYLRSSVDECKSKIRSIGFIMNTGLSGITCNLKESPKVIQIDETGF
ncbi:MAG TPA: TIGR04452 family lipoprotein [Leptospiraceae bacterium]|nr:TIGR04452 family lipoprotein [Leptospiraceae bacterium]HNF14746.1 TIGR04452 family lipoprotein [Leptospiraceae bacterium]HNF23682.1 TIGR04452 family lipoprotein [Leptospiraceae bacterium]HNH07807.1 TIGR04452 family lipoprotein [Leptospiraceae bacterium]HNI98592.1 TIGR04452 family lipoprotein [Leptospiraceae bacterium]